MFYSEDVIEEVRIRNDIVGVVSSYVKLQRRGDNYVGLCPFHGEKTPSFMVSASKQIYHCFGCGVGGTVITFVMEYENYSFPEAVKWLGERAGMSLPQTDDAAREKGRIQYRDRLLAMNKLAAGYYYRLLRSEQGKGAYAYLRDRGLGDGVIHQFGLGYAKGVRSDLYAYMKSKGYSDEEIKEAGLVKVDEQYGVRDKFFSRVVFPIMDVNGKVIGFGARVMGEGVPKYLNSPETKVFSKSRNLYGLNYARKSREKFFLLCEGYMDVIALHQAGFTNAVAALGTAFTGLQANLMKRYGKAIYLMFDGDAAGTKAALKAITILREAALPVKVVDLSPYKDPDEFIKNLGGGELEGRIATAENGFYFELDVLQREYDLKDPEQKTRFFHEVARKLLVFTEEVERGNYMEAVAERYQIKREDLRKLVNRQGLSQLDASREKRQAQREEPGFAPGESKSKPKGEDALIKAQKLFITWLTEEASLYEKVKDYVKPEDIKAEPYRRILAMAYGQLEAGGGVVPAKLIHQFESKEEQSYVASIFNEKLKGELSAKEKEKALNDVVLRIKRYGVEYEIKRATDRETLQKWMLEQTKLQKLHISL